MPHIILRNSGGAPLIDIFVGVSKPRQDALIAAGQTPPIPVQARGLIDTGATATCIDPAILSPLRIPVSGTTSMITPSTGATAYVCNQYDVALIIPHPSGQSHLFLANIAVSEAKLLNQGIGLLVGRDVLSKCLLVYDGENNIFQLAF